VSLVRLADVDPFTTVAAWRKNEHDPVVLSAADMIRRHTAQARQAPALRG
jgi:hypothetical protein